MRFDSRNTKGLLVVFELARRERKKGKETELLIVLFLSSVISLPFSFDERN